MSKVPNGPKLFQVVWKSFENLQIMYFPKDWGFGFVW